MQTGRLPTFLRSPLVLGAWAIASWACACGNTNKLALSPGLDGGSGGSSDGSGAPSGDEAGSDEGGSNAGAPSCVPTTCAAQGKDCGTIADHCGGTLDCGMCTGSSTCGGTGTANVCGQGACTATTCAALNLNCGQVSDGCSATLSCGKCVAPDTCGGGAQPNVCGHGGYTLPADRVASWTTAGLLSVGGVPSARWSICNATPLSPSGGDDSVPINSAIQGCPEGSIVLLGPGTFTMGKGHFVIINKGVVLRGAGAGVTIIKNPLNLPATKTNQNVTDTTPIIVVGRNRFASADGDGHCDQLTAYQTNYMQLLTADGKRGTNSVTVGDPSLFSSGQIVLVDETSGAGWQPDVAGTSTSIWASNDYAVTWINHNPTNSTTSAIDDPLLTGVTPSVANNFAGCGTGKDAACWQSRQDRPQNEIKQIASVTGNTITFDSPLTKDYRTANHAELTTYTNTDQRPYLHLRNAGVENLTVVGGGDGNVRFTNAAYCWGKNIEVSGWYGEGVAFTNSFRVELRDSYIHDAAWPEPGGVGYAISLGKGSSEILIENNVVLKANKVIVARACGAESVLGYNYMDDGYIATTEGFIESGINGSHMGGSHHMLLEGNYTFNIDSDTTHGNATYHTHFRNYATTVRAKFTSGYTGDTIDDVNTPNNGPKRAAAANIYSYNMSYVGNVLGQAGAATAANGYVDEVTNSNWGGPKGMIWLLGWDSQPSHTPDPKVAATAIRDGNWDTLLGRQTWLTNTTPAPLPPSLYLPSKPKFFGSNQWPWVDPSTGTIATLPAKARNDAGTPNAVP